MIPRILMVIHANRGLRAPNCTESESALWVTLWITPDVDIGSQKLT